MTYAYAGPIRDGSFFACREYPTKVDRKKAKLSLFSLDIVYIYIYNVFINIYKEVSKLMKNLFMDDNSSLNAENLKLKIRGEDHYRIFSIRLRKELIVALDELSARTQYSRNYLIGVLLDYALAHCNIAD